MKNPPSNLRAEHSNNPSADAENKIGVDTASSQMLSRRAMMRTSAAAIAGTAVAAQPLSALTRSGHGPNIRDAVANAIDHEVPAHLDVSQALPPGQPGRDYTPVITPNGTTLPFKIVDGVKIFHLTAEVIQHEFANGLISECWGYNGSTPGPTIEALQGDHVRIYVTNHLPAPTTIHWHGIVLPAGMDGVSGLSQAPIPVNQTFKYEFVLPHHGTFMYHTHHDEMIQQGLGLMGMLVVHQRNATRRPDRDFALLSAEWLVRIGTTRPDPNEMVEYNLFTFNGKVFPATEPLQMQLGERVRIRFGNLSAMSHHPIHVHGLRWRVVATDGGDIAPDGQWPEATVLVPVGTTRVVEFMANNPGDWAMHCHMTHHVMNQMGHSGVNMIGVNEDNLNQHVAPLLPSYMAMGGTGMGDMGTMGMPIPPSINMLGGQGPHGRIDMGGLFTILKIRKSLPPGGDPDWYVNPPGTVAIAATAAEIERDGVVIGPPVGTAAAHKHDASHQ
jgi:FtsP/CotA-like multicopper oxidase with cupredoxin domain